MESILKKFTVILDPEDDGGYSVYCPAMPGCVSQGDDRDDALKNIEEAILLVLEVLEEDKSLVASTAEDKVRLHHETPDVVAEEIREVLRARGEDGRPLTIETVELEVPYQVPA